MKLHSYIATLSTVVCWLFAIVILCGCLLCQPTLAQQPPAGPAGSTEVPDDPAQAEEPARGAQEPDAAPSESDTSPEPEPVRRRPDIGKPPYIVVRSNEQLKANRFKVMGMLRNRKFEAGEEAAFTEYYKKYVFPSWTQPENFSKLPAMRKDLRNNFLYGRTGVPHDLLNEITLDYMSKMAAANAYPAARVNAMLAIGDLNEVEPVKSGDIPVPLPAALPVLLRTIEDEDQIDPVKVAALVGIVRHARFGRLSPEARAAVQQAMLRLAGSPGIPSRSPEGHAWMRAQAVKALGYLRSVGENAVVPRGLSALVNDGELDILLRCSAAKALGRLNYTGAGGLDVTAVLAALRQLAADAIEAETDDYDEDPGSFSRRRVKARLLAVKQALVGDEDDEQSRGLAPLATGAQAQQAFGALQQTVDALLEMLDDKQMDDVDLVEKLRAALGRLGPAGAADTAQADR
jgi:hypothetical protein